MKTVHSVKCWVICNCSFWIQSLRFLPSLYRTCVTDLRHICKDTWDARQVNFLVTLLEFLVLIRPLSPASLCLPGLHTPPRYPSTKPRRRLEMDVVTFPLPQEAYCFTVWFPWVADFPSQRNRQEKSFYSSLRRQNTVTSLTLSLTFNIELILQFAFLQNGLGRTLNNQYYFLVVWEGLVSSWMPLHVVV